MFGWFRKKPKTTPPKLIWIGSAQLGWYNNDPNRIVYETMVNLFEDENGDRSVVVSGYNTEYDMWKRHKLYGRLIVPFLNGCPLDFLANNLYVYNVEYWKNKGYNVSKLVNVPDVFYKKKEKKNINKKENVIQFPPNGSK